MVTLLYSTNIIDINDVSSIKAILSYPVNTSVDRGKDDIVL